MQLISLILLKWLGWFNRYSTWNFKIYFFSSEHELHIEYLRTNQILHSFSLTVQMTVSVISVSVHSVSAQQLQQHMIEICCKMIQLPYQWTHEANHSLSSTKWSFSSEWCWPALACAFDSVPAWHPTHDDNPLAYRYGAFALVFLHQKHSVVICSLRKLYF